MDCLESLLDLQIRRKLEEKSILLAHVSKEVFNGRNGFRVGDW